MLGTPQARGQVMRWVLRGLAMSPASSILRLTSKLALPRTLSVFPENYATMKNNFVWRQAKSLSTCARPANT